MASKMSEFLDVADDRDFFGTLDSKKPGNLEEVFGNSVTNDNDNVTLKYQGPKGPGPSNSHDSREENSRSQWATVLAIAAGAYKNSESVGKVGVAILRHLSEEVGKIIFYKTKTNVLGSKTLSGVGEIFSKSNSYVQFYDDSKQYWSLLFETSEDEEEFVSKLQKFQIEVESSSLSRVETVNDSKMDDDSPVKASNTTETSNNKVTDNKLKKSLVARMARMGQPIPSLQVSRLENTSNLVESMEYTDSSGTEEIITPLAKAPAVLPRSHKVYSVKEQYVPNTVSNYSSCSTTSMESQLTQMLLSENRTQNSETRINLSKLESKIEKVLEKLDVLNMATCMTRDNKEAGMLELEEKILLLKKENHKMRLCIEELKEQSTENEIEEVLKKYHANLENLGISETNDLDQVLNNLWQVIKNLQESKRNSEEVNKAKCKELQVSILKLNEQNAEVLTKQNELHQSLTVLESAMSLSNNENLKLKTDLQLANKRASEMEVRLKAESTNAIKTIMNNMHSNICDELDALSISNKEKVLAIISKTIREETLKALTEIKK